MFEGFLNLNFVEMRDFTKKNLNIDDIGQVCQNIINLKKKSLEGQ